jgi:hypothetical protein
MSDKEKQEQNSCEEFLRRTAMSEYQNTIDTMRAMAWADEGDRITSSDLNECDTAAAIIEDLEAEIARLNRSMGEAISERDEIIDEQNAKIARLLEALIEATDSFEEYAQYAGEYLVEKHGVAEDLARLRAVAKGDSDTAGGDE